MAKVMFLQYSIDLPLGGRFRASKAAESRRGENSDFPPGPPRVPNGLGTRLQALASPVAKDCLNFRLQRKQSSAKSTLASHAA